jgi:3-oxoacyl-[acyl-carrier-protein] synthase II
LNGGFAVSAIDRSSRRRIEQAGGSEVNQRRVVVTGLGAVSPVGNAVPESWENLIAGKSGIGPVTRFDATGFGSRIAGEVNGFDVEQYLPANKARHMDLFIQYGFAAGVQAIRDSGLQITDANAERIGAVLGPGVGALPMIEQNMLNYWRVGRDAFHRSSCLLQLQT